MKLRRDASASAGLKEAAASYRADGAIHETLYCNSVEAEQSLRSACRGAMHFEA